MFDAEFMAVVDGIMRDTMCATADPDVFRRALTAELPKPA
jgi:hypothetical protein